jgi:hypothetical protein
VLLEWTEPMAEVWPDAKATLHGTSFGEPDYRLATIIAAQRKLWDMLQPETRLSVEGSGPNGKYSGGEGPWHWLLSELMFHDASLRQFVQAMIADGPPWTDVVFDEIGRGPSDVRDRVASAARSITAELERSRSAFSMMDFPDDSELQAMVRASAEKPNPWLEYAARLGVDAGN